jgi:hypothetical protein
MEIINCDVETGVKVNRFFRPLDDSFHRRSQFETISFAKQKNRAGTIQKQKTAALPGTKGKGKHFAGLFDFHFFGNGELIIK